MLSPSFFAVFVLSFSLFLYRNILYSFFAQSQPFSRLFATKITENFVKKHLPRQVLFSYIRFGSVLLTGGIHRNKAGVIGRQSEGNFACGEGEFCRKGEVGLLACGIDFARSAFGRARKDKGDFLFLGRLLCVVRQEHRSRGALLIL